MKTIISIVIFLCWAAIANAQIREVNPGYPHERDRVRDDGGAIRCEASVDQSVAADMHSLADELHGLIECGNKKIIYGHLQALSQLAQELAKDNSGDRGNCWDARGCRGNLASTSLIPKSVCQSIGGRSWQQKLPTVGKCVNL